MPMVATTTVTRMPPHSDGRHDDQPDQRRAVQQHVGQDRQHDEKIDRAEVAARRRQPQQPYEAEHQSHKEHIDAPALAERIEAIDEIGEPDPDEGPARARIRPRRRSETGLADRRRTIPRRSERNARAAAPPRRSAATQRASARYWPDEKTDWRASSRTRRPAPTAAAAARPAPGAGMSGRRLALIAVSAPQSRRSAR